jgi:hypothetical protein
MTHGDLSVRLVEKVLGFATPHYALGTDVFHLSKVKAVGAPEAIVTYCARMLEVLAFEALRTAGLTPSLNAFSNLEVLQDFHLIPPTTLQCAHGLRRIGNDVRHVRRAVTDQDADIALLFTERWLEWFFGHFPFGCRVPSLTGDGQPLGLCRHAKLRDLIVALEKPKPKLQPLVDLFRGPQGEEYLKTASLPAMLAERCLDCGDFSGARVILDIALGRFQDDLRLRHLMGLYYSRTGDLDHAKDCLEPLADQNPDDEETMGILAGVHKRKWLKDRTQRECLLKSHRTYRDGWLGSKKTNTWLGINAATTALWLRRGAESRQIARDVQKVLRSRAELLAAQHFDPGSASTYWDLATRAESELLMGELAEARRIYKEAFQFESEESEGSERIKVTRRQAEEIGEAMGFSFTPEASTGTQPQPSPGDGPSLIVGVTGHRRLAGGDALRERVAEAVAMLRSELPAPPQGPLVALSALAEGADRLVAHLVLDETPAGALEVVLPLEIDDYIRDFKSNDSIAEFRSLLGRAERITILAPERKARATPAPSADAELADRQAAYEACARFVVDRCAVLVAIWDGQPARGRGGTAEVVAYARQCRRPLVWVQAAPPHAPVFERMGPGTAHEPAAESRSAD